MARTTMYKRVCRVCGKTYLAASPNGNLCSKECWRVAKRASNEKYKQEHHVDIKAKCVICGKEFIKKGCQKTCSTACSMKNRQKTMQICQKEKGKTKIPAYACLTVQQSDEFLAKQAYKSEWRKGNPRAVDEELRLAKELGVSRTDLVTARDSMRPQRFQKWKENKLQEKKKKEFWELVKRNEGL